MSSLASPAETRAYIVERLVGDTVEPDLVTAAGRVLAERAAPLLSLKLAEELAVTLGIGITTVEVARLCDARPVGQAVVLAQTAFAGAADGLTLSLDAAAVALLVHCLFGGDPVHAVAPIERELSPTELHVAALVLEQIAAAFGDGQALPVEAIAGAELEKLALRDGPGVRIVLTLAAPGASGEATATIPQRLLMKQQAAGEAGGDWGQRFGEEIMRSSVELEATMPLARMTLADLASLAIGDIIELEPEARSSAMLAARGKTLFVCELGKLGQNYTMRVRHPFDAGQDFIDGLLAR